MEEKKREKHITDAINNNPILRHHNKLPLIAYDTVVFAVVIWLLLGIGGRSNQITVIGIFVQAGICWVCIFGSRLTGKVYKQIWRYGGIQCYIRLLVTDTIGSCLYILIARVLPIQHITFPSMLAVCATNCLGALAIRMLYRYAYKCGSEKTRFGRFMGLLLRVFAGIDGNNGDSVHKIKVAIIGAGRVGVSLAEELLSNSTVGYLPRCFVDVSMNKQGREIHGIPVFSEDTATFAKFREFEIQEIIFAIPTADVEKKKQLYNYYKQYSSKIKTYDYPAMQNADGKRHLREFDVEDLLFRKPLVVIDDKTVNYYQEKVILITGGGGSIGAELCRQLAKMKPKQLIILDIYENGAYTVHQELKFKHGKNLDVRIEILSITNREGMEKVFQRYSPDVVINAAAHKHVPLMEHNCVEAVTNNIFGTKILVDLCEKYRTERFLMVSTDKAVNPTNVMGATKRMCEMIVQCAATYGRVKYSATRFGNVLGSAGSVIPLFKSQIANGGPVTITDKRIIRYFMTIQEASQLVLESGVLANNGELMVLDMGQPIRILDLAENMIRLSGIQGIEIIETGLRPGEKLYEELLVLTEDLDKTDNNLIFVERDSALSKPDLESRLEILMQACETQDDDYVRETLKKVVPTYRSPEEVNAEAIGAKEMREVREFVTA